MRTLHLFAGCGGGLFADRILGHQPIVAVEIDPFRADLLVRSFPETEILNQDIHNVDFRCFNGQVDAVCAGVPCPKWSTARHNVGSPEDLVNETVRAIQEIRPTWVFLECVPAFAEEHTRIQRMLYGYTLGRPLLSDASIVGAPFARKRCWILARAYEDGEPVLPVYDEAPELPPIGPSVWEDHPVESDLDDGMARKLVEALGDGQVPLQAAHAWILLGGPTGPGLDFPLRV
jgi:site-specific DNA-cytosine methylase